MAARVRGGVAGPGSLGFGLSRNLANGGEAAWHRLVEPWGRTEAVDKENVELHNESGCGSRPLMYSDKGAMEGYKAR